MTNKIDRIVILGAGQIGDTIADLLAQTGDYRLRIADRDAARLAPHTRLHRETRVLDYQDEPALREALTGSDAVISALPFHAAVRVAGVAARLGVHYFDLTEDVASTRAIRDLGGGARAVLMPQCGLAPGFIGIAGMDLARRFDTLLDLRLRVGALPRFPSNAMKYNLTWSTEGLINEYCNPCEAIVDGQRVLVAALEAYEQFSIDGIEYEAFNTSGGLGTLTETLGPGSPMAARNVDYKSIRYPGHCSILKLLLNDLRLRDQRDMLRDIFENAIPATGQDVVVIFATASGMRDGRLVQESVSRSILGETIGGRARTAIQLTTAASVCAALELVRDGTLPGAGFIRQEDIALPDFAANRFGRRLLGATEPLISAA